MATSTASPFMGLSFNTIALEDYFLYTRAGTSKEAPSLAYFVIDGALDKDSCRGAAAWVQDRASGEALFQTSVCDAS